MGDLLGYRSDPTPGFAHRAVSFEYEGETDILHFRLSGSGRLREVVAGTTWEVRDVCRGDSHGYYRATLEKQ